MLQSEVQLQKMVSTNSSEIIKIMTSFFRKSYEEITSLGMNLSCLDTVQAVLSEAHTVALRNQISQLKLIEKKIEQALPSVSILQEFMDLLNYLRSLHEQEDAYLQNRHNNGTLFKPKIMTTQLFTTLKGKQQE